MCTCLHACVCLWRSQDDFQGVVLSFYNVNTRSCTQVVRLGCKCLYPTKQRLDSGGSAPCLQFQHSPSVPAGCSLWVGGQPGAYSASSRATKATQTYLDQKTTKIKQTKNLGISKEWLESTHRFQCLESSPSRHPLKVLHSSKGVSFA